MKILAKSPRSVCVELDGHTPYFSAERFVVFLNDKKVREEDRNVFSLFGLVPDSDYTITADGQAVSFRTDRESALFNVRQFNACGDGEHDDTEAFAAVSRL